MHALKEPRFWLLTVLGLGALGLVYVIMAASVQPRQSEGPSALDMDASLLVGEMADFAYTFPPRAAPDYPFDFNGEAMTLADFRGKAVLVNFWATFCLPCIAELPSLNSLQEELGGNRFEVVAIAADPGGPEKAAEFLNRHQIDKLALYSDQRLTMSIAMGADVLPMSILYDAKGREIGRLVGEADWSSPEAVRLVSSVIP